MSERRSQPTKKMNAREVGDMLGLRGPYILDLARKNAIPHVRIGKYVRFDEADIAAWWDAGCPANEQPARGLRAA